MPNIKQIQLGELTYDILAKYIQDTNGAAKDWNDILDLVNAAKLPIVVAQTLPTASEETVGSLYLIPETGSTTGTYVEYVTIQSGSSYSWERIGTTDADLTDYVKKGTYTDAATSAGAHTHTVSGEVTVPTVSTTDKFLTATASGTAATADGTAEAITGFGTHTTADVITGFGAHTTATVLTGVSVTADPTVALAANSASADGRVQVATGITSSSTTADTADQVTVVTGLGTPSTTEVLTGVTVTAQPTVALAANAATGEGRVEVATGIDTVSTTVTPATTFLGATASGTAVDASATDTFVKSYPGTTSKMVTTTITGVAGTESVATVTNNGNVTNGTAAAWGASVSNDGVLSFSWTANDPTAVTLPTFGSATVATADAAATTVATGSLDAAAAGGEVMTGLGTATTADAVTGVTVTTQPTITLASNAATAAGRVEVATGITSASTTVTPTTTYLGATASGTAVGASGTADAVTALGTPSTDDVLGVGTGFTTTVTPTTTYLGATASGTAVAASGTADAITALGTPTTAAAITALGTPTTATVLTGVKISVQPTITLADTGATGVAFVSAVTTGTTTASLTNGAAASAGDHTHDVTIN